MCPYKSYVSLLFLMRPYGLLKVLLRSYGSMGHNGSS